MKDESLPQINFTTRFNKQRKTAPLEIMRLKRNIQVIEVLMSMTIGEHYLKFGKVSLK